MEKTLGPSATERLVEEDLAVARGSLPVHVAAQLIPIEIHDGKAPRSDLTLRRETRGLVSESNVGDAGHRVDDFDLKLLPLGIHAHAVYSWSAPPSLLRPRHSAESSARPSWKRAKTVRNLAAASVD